MVMVWWPNSRFSGEPTWQAEFKLSLDFAAFDLAP